MADNFKEIGAILAAARREKNKSLKEAEESTKIMAHYLEAIEAGEAEKLPTREYFMLFARGYAQYLGVDPSKLEGLEETPIPEKASSAPGKKKAEEEPEPEGEEPEAQARKFGKTLLYIIVAIVVVFAAFFVYIQWFAGGIGKTTEPGYSESGESNSGSEQGGAEAAPAITFPDQPYQPPGKLDLRMVAKQDVWAVVIRDGDTVLNRKLEAGQQRQWDADYRYKLTLGVSNAVDLYVNGDKLAPLSARARTITGLEINQVNYKQYFNPPTDTLPTGATPSTPAAQSQRQGSIDSSWIESRRKGDTAAAPSTPTTQSQIQKPVDDSWIERRPEADTATRKQPEQQKSDTAAIVQPPQQNSQVETPPAADTGGADGN
jgi:cytoskeleton protein RodZ